MNDSLRPGRRLMQSVVSMNTLVGVGSVVFRFPEERAVS
jgi:hypothetical protein